MSRLRENVCHWNVPQGTFLQGPGRAGTDCALDCGSGIGRVSKHVRIRQNTADTYFVRSMEFYRTDGQVYMIIFNHMSGDGSDMDVHKCYHITDPELADYIRGKMDECNRIIRDEYGHEEEEY